MITQTVHRLEYVTLNLWLCSK